MKVFIFFCRWNL